MAFQDRLALIITANGQQAIGEIGRVGKSAERDLGRAEGSAKRFSLSAVKLGAGLVAAGGVAIPVLFRLANAASDVNEQISASKIVFDENAGSVQKWSAGLAASFGISQRAALQAANGFGDLFNNVGVTGDRAAEFSTHLVELAGDLASFKNLDPGDVLEKLRSGLVGETEPLRNLGVFLNEAVVQQKAMEMGLVGVNGKVTDGAKVQARYALILEQTKTAQGDFARTSEGLANQQRIAAAEAENAQAAFGQGLAGGFAAATKTVSDLTRSLGSANPELAKTAGAVAGIGAATAIGVGALALLSGAAASARQQFIGAGGAVTGFGKAARGLGLAGGTLGAIELLAAGLNAVTGAGKDASTAVSELSKVSTGQLVDEFKKLGKDRGFGLKQFAEDVKELSPTYDQHAEKLKKAFKDLAESNPATARRLLDALRAAGEETSGYEEILRAAGIAAKQAGKDAAASAGGFEEQGDAAKKTAEDVHSLVAATLDAGDAEDKLGSALEKLAEAQAVDKTADVAAATQDLTSAQLSQESAVNRLTDAQDRLNELKNRDITLELRRAQLADRRAQQNAREAQHAKERAQTELDRLRGDTASTPEQIAKATEELEDATLGVDEANQSAADSAKAVVDLQNPQGTKEYRDAVLAVKDAQNGVAQANDAVTAAHKKLNDARAKDNSGDITRATRDVQRAMEDIAKNGGTVDQQIAAYQRLMTIVPPAFRGFINDRIAELKALQYQAGVTQGSLSAMLGVVSGETPPAPRPPGALPTTPVPNPTAPADAGNVSKLFPTVPTAPATPTGIPDDLNYYGARYTDGRTFINIDTVQAHDYEDFRRQMDEQRRLNALAS